MGIDQKLIDEIIRRVRGVAQPDRIILFGSAASGQMNQDSDIDLLILKSDAVDVRAEQTRIRRALSDIDYAFDIIVISTEYFEESKNVFGGIAWPANKYGKVIHEAA